MKYRMQSNLSPLPVVVLYICSPTGSIVLLFPYQLTLSCCLATVYNTYTHSQAVISES